ncbi:hypothetical protein Dimus_013912, partial [Dionaea muscipula]
MGSGSSKRAPGLCSQREHHTSSGPPSRGQPLLATSGGPSSCGQPLLAAGSGLRGQWLSCGQRYSLSPPYDRTTRLT